MPEKTIINPNKHKTIVHDSKIPLHEDYPGRAIRPDLNPEVGPHDFPHRIPIIDGDDD